MARLQRAQKESFTFVDDVNESQSCNGCVRRQVAFIVIIVMIDALENLALYQVPISLLATLIQTDRVMTFKALLRLCNGSKTLETLRLAGPSIGSNNHRFLAENLFHGPNIPASNQTLTLVFVSNHLGEREHFPLCVFQKKLRRGAKALTLC